MAAENLIIVLVGGSSGTTHKQSKDLEMRLKALGIGASNIQITDNAGVLEIAAKLKVQDGTAAGEVATKGQLDTAVTSLQGGDAGLQAQIDTLDGRADGHDTDILNLQTNLATETSNRTTQDGVLQGQITTLDGRVDGHDVDLTTLDGRADGHDTSIASLQGDLAAILANNPAEQTFVVGIGGQSIFTLTGFQVDADNSIYDVECYVDGRRMLLDPAGLLTKGFRKNSTTVIELSETVPEGKEVTFWKQGTSSAGGGGGSDLTAIVVDPRPAVHGDKALGTGIKAWKSVFLKDKTTADVWELEVSGGVLQATLVV